MGTGNNVLMLGVLTEKVFQILSSGKSSLGTHGLGTSIYLEWLKTEM